MAVVINGSGTVTGLAVGGLPDGIVDSGTLATNSVDSAELIDGAVDNSHIDAMAASKLTGALPAIDGSSLTGMSGGLYASVAIICDEKAYNVSGGTFTSGAWRTRDLNTEVSDADGIVSISSNQFTLGAGTYTIDWSAPVYNAQAHAAQLYDVTGAAVIQMGMAMHAISNQYGVSSGSATVTIGSSNVFEIQHRCTNTQVGNGFGVDSGWSGAISIYAIVKILKHS